MLCQKARQQILIVEHSSERMKGNDYNFNLCEACIILKRTNFSDALKELKNVTPVPLAENLFSAKRGEGGSGYEAFAEKRKRNGASFFDDRSSWKERKGNALASGADEGRDKLR